MEEELLLPGPLFSRYRWEILGGGILLFSLCPFCIGADMSLAGALVLTGFLWTAAVFDYHCGFIFDWLTMPMAVCGVCFHLYEGADIPQLCLGLLAGGGPLLLIRWLSRGGMGGGDVKLAAAGGIWLGWQQSLAALALSSWIGGIAAVLLLISGRRNRKDEIAFGPFLSMGIWIAFLFGEELLKFYGDYICG